MSASLVGSEMCIRDRAASPSCAGWMPAELSTARLARLPATEVGSDKDKHCLLYTSDAADDM
eukprot:279468-Alexandrium_andersonii.AAC.1